MLELLGPAPAWGLANKRGINEQSSTDTLEWQQLAALSVWGKWNVPPVPGGWLSVLARQRRACGAECVTCVGLQENVLGLCPMGLKQPLCPSRASAAPRAVVSSEKY